MTGHGVPELASFDETMLKFMQPRNIPCGALAVTRLGKLVLARGYSWDRSANFSVEPTSRFRIASITKPFTSAAILQLVERKKLALTDRLSSHLKLAPAPGQRPDPRLSQITLSQVLQHLGGWDRDQSFDPMFYDVQIKRDLGRGLPIKQQDIITFMNGQPLDHAPGTQYAYSNYGYMLLGRVIEAASGQRYADYVRQNILAPLHITQMVQGRALSQFRLPDEVPYFSLYTGPTVYDNSGRTVPSAYGSFNLENMDSHGGWLASAIDLVRFASAFDDANIGQILSGSSIKTIFAMPPTGMQPDGSYYGCGWEVRPVNGGRNTWHNGSLPGTSTLMVRRFDGLSWAVLFNQREDKSDPNGTTYGDIDGLLHQAADAVTTWPTHDLFGEYLK